MGAIKDEIITTKGNAWIKWSLYDWVEVTPHICNIKITIFCKKITTINQNKDHNIDLKIVDCSLLNDFENKFFLKKATIKISSTGETIKLISDLT